MSLVYGYNLKEGDKIIAAPVQATEVVSRLMLPGAAMINHLPFCAISYSIPAVPVSHSYS